MKNFKDVVMAMVGQPFFYEPKGEDVLIRDWKFEKDILSIFTDKGVFTAEFTDIDEFLRKFRNSDTKSLTVQVIQPQLPGAVITGKILEKIRDEALRNIEKVQGDKEYIPQAQQVESNLKILLDVAKTEIEITKVSHVISNGGKR